MINRIVIFTEHRWDSSWSEKQAVFYHLNLLGGVRWALLHQVDVNIPEVQLWGDFISRFHGSVLHPSRTEGPDSFPYSLFFCAFEQNFPPSQHTPCTWRKWILVIVNNPHPHHVMTSRRVSKQWMGPKSHKNISKSTDRTETRVLGVSNGSSDIIMGWLQDLRFGKKKFPWAIFSKFPSNEPVWVYNHKQSFVDLYTQKEAAILKKKIPLIPSGLNSS